MQQSNSNSVSVTYVCDVLVTTARQDGCHQGRGTLHIKYSYTNIVQDDTSIVRVNG